MKKKKPYNKGPIQDICILKFIFFYLQKPNQNDVQNLILLRHGFRLSQRSSLGFTRRRCLWRTPSIGQRFQQHRSFNFALPQNIHLKSVSSSRHPITNFEFPKHEFLIVFSLSNQKLLFYIFHLSKYVLQK